MDGTVVPARNEITAEHTWNATSVFASQDAWETEFRAIEAVLPVLKSRKDTVSDGATTLMETFLITEDAHRRVNKLLVYARSLSE